MNKLAVGALLAASLAGRPHQHVKPLDSIDEVQIGATASATIAGLAACCKVTPSGAVMDRITGGQNWEVAWGSSTESGSLKAVNGRISEISTATYLRTASDAIDRFAADASACSKPLPTVDPSGRLSGWSPASVSIIREFDNPERPTEGFYNIQVKCEHGESVMLSSHPRAGWVDGAVVIFTRARP